MIGCGALVSTSFGATSSESNAVRSSCTRRRAASTRMRTGGPARRLDPARAGTQSRVALPPEREV